MFVVLADELPIRKTGIFLASLLCCFSTKNGRASRRKPEHENLQQIGHDKVRYCLANLKPASLRFYCIEEIESQRICSDACAEPSPSV